MSALNADRPELEAPGAGLSAPVLFVARRLFALKCRRGDCESFLREFRDERRRIRALVEGCPSFRRGERVFIPRLRGLEDSSRYYSVWMTLDHLRLTNLGFEQVIAELTAGRPPDLVVRTADVKPDPAVTASVEGEYERACDRFLTLLAAGPDLDTELTHAHPWFGPLDAFRWLALAAMHMGIHRRQIEAIVARLPE